MKLSEKRTARVMELRDAALLIVHNGGPLVEKVEAEGSAPKHYKATVAGAKILYLKTDCGVENVTVYADGRKVLGINWEEIWSAYTTCFVPGDWEAALRAEAKPMPVFDAAAALFHDLFPVDNRARALRLPDGFDGGVTLH